MLCNIFMYRPSESSDRRLTCDEIYLCDSGAQFRYAVFSSRKISLPNNLISKSEGCLYFSNFSVLPSTPVTNLPSPIDSAKLRDWYIIHKLRVTTLKILSLLCVRLSGIKRKANHLAQIRGLILSTIKARFVFLFQRWNN